MALVIGICGGTGSGKTTIAERIAGSIAEQSVLILRQDHYYKDFPHVPAEELAKRNFDHPDAIDAALLIEHVRMLRANQGIDRPIYDFTRHRRETNFVKVDPRPAVIVEGILIFENQMLRELMDIKIFVDTDADIRFIRRLSRDVRERGRTVESVIEQYLDTVRPMHQQFIETSKRHADVIIPEGGQNEVGIDLVIQKILSLIPAAKTSARKTSTSAARAD